MPPQPFTVAGEVFQVQIADQATRSNWNHVAYHAEPLVEVDRRIQDFLLPEDRPRWLQLRSEDRITARQLRDIYLWLMGENRASIRKRKRGRS